MTLNYEWENRFLEMARLVSSWSKDPSTKVGAVLVSGRHVLGTGYNGFPVGCDDSAEIYLNRDEKYRRVVHAEVNALLNAQGKKGDEMSLYSTLCPCSQCAAMIINFGVRQVFCPVPTHDQLERWGASFDSASKMFKEAEVKMWFLPDP
jgi:dCMP deaminase